MLKSTGCLYRPPIPAGSANHTGGSSYRYMMSAALRHRIGILHDDNDSGSSDFTMDSLRSSVQHRAASTDLVPEDKALELHICQRCQKEFSRLCDLNKHSKSHSRPFKCSHQDCKYYSLGWPTAKELERHVNDKHLATPKTFPCLFPPCPYRSKRDSNRKQHMEKMHGWKYTRSKSNGKVLVRSEGTSQPALLTSSGKGLAHAAQHSNLVQPIQQPQFVQQNDFLLYDQTVADSAVSPDHSDDDDDEPQGPDSQESNVVVPWTSPETRLQRRKTELLEFSEKFNQTPHMSSAGRCDVPVDPRLALTDMRGTLPARADTFRFEGRGIPSHSKRRLGYSPPSELGIATDISGAVRSSAGATYSPSFRQATGSSISQQHGGPSRTGFGYHQPAKAAPQQIRNRPLPPVKRNADEDKDEEDEPPRKKVKPSPKSDFNDSEMLDIFHVAYPDTYNDRNPKYKSCHTPFDHISILARHLVRAHGMEKTERYIHSFDVPTREGERYVHCHVGICRWCWHVYTDRDEFNRHISHRCEKVSKGKEQKWRTIYDAFTPFISDTLSSAQGNIPLEEIGPANPPSHVQAQPGHGIAPEHIHADNDDLPHDAPSPTTIEMGSPEERERERPSAAGRLSREQQLIALAQCLSRGILALQPSQVSSTDSGSSMVNPATPTLMQLQRFALRVTETFPRRQPLQQDNTRQPLLGLLALQQTELPQGLSDDINSQHDEIISQQSLSRSSSGLSSSARTAVRHVPNYFEDVGNGAQFPQAAPPVGHLQTMMHPPSHIDSGYVSGNRSSLTEAEAANMQNCFPPDDGTAFLDQMAAGQQQSYGYEQTPADQPPDPVSPSTVFEGLDMGGYRWGSELIEDIGWSQPFQPDS